MTINNFDSHSSNENQKTQVPTIINCKEGTCVFYKEHYLYSKYNPSKSINNIISNLSIAEDSLVLIFSPVLWHGIDLLISKVPPSSQIIAIEYDLPLFNLAQEHLAEKYKDKILLLNQKQENLYLNLIQNKHFKKITRIDFSAGITFYKEKYDKLFLISQSIVDQFLKNRLTLIKFGRLFSKNIFKNFKLLAKSIPLENFYNSVEKPVLVLGAGESLNETLKEIKGKENLFYILAVDAALNTLLLNKIKPDAIVAVESQLAIEKAYIGLPTNSKIHIFADLVSRNHILEIVNGSFSFFISEYEKMNFLNRLSQLNILPPKIKPLGSVGLVAMELALRLRKSDNVNILFSGLDFSYTAGITHSKNTSSHINLLTKTNKLSSIYNIDSAFNTGTSLIKSKNNSKMITTISLKNYSLLFSDLFSNEKNIYDVSHSGMELGFNKLNILQFDKIVNQIDKDSLKNNKNNNNSSIYSKKEKISKDLILDFIKNEINELQILKDILTFGDDSQYRSKTEDLQTQINKLIYSREYLFVHFPDAFGKTNLQSFLNRIRIEINFFLKELHLSKKLIQS